MYVEVLKAGLATSIQDKGRPGLGRFGIPESGAMDRYAAKLANLLVGNREDSAVMEITLMGPNLYFDCTALAAVAGIDAEVLLNRMAIPVNKPFLVPKSSVLEIKKITEGKYLYLAVKDGFQLPRVMNSRSMYAGITSKSMLEKKDRIHVTSVSGNLQNSFSSIRFNKERYSTSCLSVFPGPEFSRLPENIKQQLFHQTFTLSNDSNRMAYLFEECIQNNLQPILTGPVLPGTVQLTPSGKIVVLMRDGQVTGGYPRVLQLHADCLDILAQKRPGEKIGFYPR